MLGWPSGRGVPEPQPALHHSPGFQQDAFGQASAVAWVLFILIFSLTLVQFRWQRRYSEET